MIPADVGATLRDIQGWLDHDERARLALRELVVHLDQGLYDPIKDEVAVVLDGDLARHLRDLAAPSGG